MGHATASPRPGPGRAEPALRAVACALVLAGTAAACSGAPSDTIVVWQVGEPAPAGEIQRISRGPAVPLVQDIHGPRTLADLPGPAPGAQPVRVRVPGIDTSAPVISLGLDEAGALEVPGTAHETGWYRNAPRPGERGPAVVAGHVQLGRQSGVFADLRRVEPGAVVHVDYDDGTTFSFVVYAREQHAKPAFPTERVYGDTQGAELRLITCGGDLDPSSRHHLDNVVVYADLVARS